MTISTCPKCYGDGIVGEHAEMCHCEITIENRSGTELKEAIYEWLKQPYIEKE